MGVKLTCVIYYPWTFLKEKRTKNPFATSKREQEEKMVIIPFILCMTVAHTRD